MKLLVHPVIALPFVMLWIACGDATTHGSSGEGQSNRTPIPVKSYSERGHVNLESFRRLQRIVGTWQGQTPDSKIFYETYEIMNDSTFRMYMRPFGLSGSIADSARIFMNDGRVYIQSQVGRWVSSDIGENGVLFLPMEPTAKRIRWSFPTTDAWRVEATVAGISKVYILNRVPDRYTRTF